MTKTKKTKAKAPAPAKAASEMAQPVVPPAALPPVKAKPALTAGTQSPATTPEAPAAPAQPKVRLEFFQPEARTVAIAGSFNSWQPEQVSATANGQWVKELAISPGRYEYMFVVDGQWMADPNAREFVPNPFGGQNSVLHIQS